MITSGEQISPPSLVRKQNSSHLHSLGVNILFNFSALGIHLWKTWQLFNFKTRLGREICLSDVNTRKGHCVVNGWAWGARGVHVARSKSRLAFMCPVPMYHGSPHICMVIQDIPGFLMPRCGFWISIVSEIMDSLSSILDSKSKNFPNYGIRITLHLETWYWQQNRSSYSESHLLV